MVVDPQRTYEALGKFIARRTPYTDVQLPDFGVGTDADDQRVLGIQNPNMPAPFQDKHVILETGPYATRGFFGSNPSTGKSEDLDPAEFLTCDVGDGVMKDITKAIRIEYKHKRKADDKICDAFIIVLFSGDSH